MAQPHLNTADRLSFAELVHLYQTDPDAFEAYRMATIDAEIQKCSPDHQERLRAMMWAEERRLEQYGNGIARYNAVITGLYFKQYPELLYAIQALKEYCGIAEADEGVWGQLATHKRHSADIVDLKTHREEQ